jgi:hypothetical protein
MPRKDSYHDIVKTALAKDGWRVVDDPLRVVAGGVGLFIDLSAEPILTFELGSNLIAIEIKSFEIESQITTFYEAFGKYLTYRKAIEMTNKEMDLYLAVPKKAFDSIFQKDLIKALVKEFRVNIVIYNIVNQSVVLWIKH